MAGEAANAELKNLFDTLYDVGVVGGLTDGQLLQRLAVARDEPARAVFAALVERHGPMVLHVCRQVLGDSHDAQDAFQATFLVLARRSGSVRQADSVASWLHGVAFRVAGRARADAIRRRVHERRGGLMKAADRDRDSEEDDQPGSWPELQEEIARLPGRYREPVVLCYLEGLSTEAAAVRIGCARGTVLSRLSRARERLHRGLVRRGVTLPAGLAAATLVPEAAATAALPAALVEATVRAALGFAGRRANEAALASATTTALARGVLSTMTISKLKILGAATLVCALALGGIRSFAGRLGDGDNDNDETGSSAVPAADQDDRRAALGRSFDRIQSELDGSARRIAELQAEVQALRALVMKNKGTVPPTPATPAKTADVGAGIGTRSNPPGAALAGVGPGHTPRSPSHQYLRYGDLIIGVTSRGDRAFTYDKTTKNTHFLEVPASGWNPLTVVSIVGPGSGTLYVKGRNLTQIAVIDIVTGNWYPLDLRAPVNGDLIPIVTAINSGLGTSVAYGSGRYAYAFSPQTKRWSVAELPEGFSAKPDVGASNFTIEGSGHIFTFNAKSGEWDHLDFNAILGDRPPSGTGPEK